MLESIALIGRTLAGGGASVKDFIKPLPRPKSKDGTSYILKLDFRTSNGPPFLAVEPFEAKGDDRKAAEQFCWVGNEQGNRPQFYLTTDQLKYLIGQTPANLKRLLEESGAQNTALYRKVLTLLTKFYRLLPGGTYLLDPYLLGLTQEDLLGEIAEKGHNWSKKELREKVEAVSQAAQEIVKKWSLERAGLKASEVSLWTVLLDGTVLAADPSYADFIFRIKKSVKQSRKNGKSPEGACMVCGTAKQTLTTDFSKLAFLKYYITDKLGAASGVWESGFVHNFQACENCFSAFALAEKFVRQDLSLSVGGLSFLVLPHFLHDPRLRRGDLISWAGSLKNRVSAYADFAGWLGGLGDRQRGLEAELADLLEELPHENAALLNFLFYSYQGGRSEFKVLGLIKDVAPSRISRLLRQSNALAARAEKLLGKDRWWLDLTAVYRLMPLSKGPRGVEHKKLLYVYHSLLAASPLKKDFLVKQFVSLAKIYLTGSFDGTSVQKPKEGWEEIEWSRRLMQANLLLKFLRDEKLLEEGMSLEDPAVLDELVLPPDIRSYLDEMKYSGPQTALFLLGYLMCAVGQKQRERSYENKPVLEKINYGGMTWAKVVRLANILVDQLRQYDIFKYYEGLYSSAKVLLDSCRPGAHYREWPLSAEENVFCILSGYAYGTRLALKNWAEKQDSAKNAQKPEEEV